MIDQVVGNFRVVSLLGQGGMGEVYLAEHQGIQTRVAIKMLMPEISQDQSHVQRFFNEARIVGRIKHAGIVKIFDVGFHNGRAYLVMELLEGESLAGRIQRTGRIPTAELVDIAHQIASVLAASHAAGVIHRDLKPDNVYLVPDAALGDRARVKVLDFGIAKLSDASGPRTVGTMGTPAYMAPEQWGDSGSVDWRADIYSLGCVGFEMATGKPPFAATTIAEAFRNHTQAPPPSVRTFAPELPGALEVLFHRMLAKQPADRALSSPRLVEELEAMRSVPCEGAHVPVPTQSVLIRRAATTLGASVGQIARAADPKRRRGLVAAIAIGAALAVVATIAATRGGSSEIAAASAPSAPPPAPPPSREPPTPLLPAPPAPVTAPAPPAVAPTPASKPSKPSNKTPVIRRKPSVPKPPASPTKPPRSELKDRT